VLKQCRAIEQKSSAKLIFAIDQSNDPTIKQKAVGKLKSAQEGVCAMMTANWIRLNKESFSRRAAHLGFQTLVNEKMDSLVIEQVIYMLELDNRNKLVEQRQKAVGEYKTLTGGLQAPGPTASTQVVELYKKIKLMDQIIAAAHDAEIKRQGGGYAGNNVGEDLPVKSLPLALLQLISKQGNGYYALSFNSTSGSGHIIGIEITSHTYRLMDANTGEWDCSGPPGVADLLKELLSTFYSSYASFTVYHYK